MRVTLKNPYVYGLLILPPLILYVVFFISPFYDVMHHGFYNWDGVNKPTFVGMKNFSKLMSDSDFWHSFMNNIYFILFSIFIQLPIMLIISMLIAQSRSLQGFYKTTVFFPAILSTSVIGIIWSIIYHPEVGLLNQTLKENGLQSWTHSWLSDPHMAMSAILVTNSWQWTGVFIVMLLVALLGIPKELEEAAAIDGASGWKTSIFIKLPLIQPVIVVTITLSITGAMKAMDIIIVMTGGGPFRSTDVMATYMISQSYGMGHYGYGSAVATLLIVLSLVFTLLFMAISRKTSMDGEG